MEMNILPENIDNLFCFETSERKLTEFNVLIDVTDVSAAISAQRQQTTVSVGP